MAYFKIPIFLQQFEYTSQGRPGDIGFLRQLAESSYPLPFMAGHPPMIHYYFPICKIDMLQKTEVNTRLSTPHRLIGIKIVQQKMGYTQKALTPVFYPKTL